MRSVNVVSLVTFISALNISAKTNAFRIFDVDGMETILAVEHENVSLLCETGAPMTYCGFVHPNGKRYSFSGSSLINGHCAVRIRATQTDAGSWRCHIGRNTGVELRRELRLRVVGRLAALRARVPAVHGQPATLVCVTTRDKLPLQYCRFEPPNGTPFSIDSAITAAQPLLDRYHYPQNLSLDRGDCAVTIRRVRYGDAGAWTCGAGVGDGREHVDTVRLDVEGLYTMSTASTTGVTVGAIAVVAVLAGLGAVAWKRRRLLGARPREPETIEVQELQRSPRQSPRSARQSPRSPSRSPRSARQSPRSPSRSPRSISPMVAERAVPSVVIQSPSEPRSSP